jgi:aminoglycoside/choline kinase family phosphotransferase
VSRQGIKTAFILGAGLGTRLRPLTDTCPKPLLTLAGRPMITYVMDHLLSIGVERFIVNTHHCADIYEKIFSDKSWRGVPIIFRHELVLLDTAGGLKNIEDLLDQDETILIYNGDVISDLPLQKLMETHFLKGSEVTLALRSSGQPLNVNINDNNEICDLRHVLKNPGTKRCFFTGIYVVEKQFLDRLEAGRTESVVDVFLRMIREHPGSVRGAVIDEGVCSDIGSLEEYERVSALLSETQQDVSTAEISAFVRCVLKLSGTTNVQLIPLSKGASDRAYWRISYGDDETAIFMRYNPARQENNYYVAIAGFLESIGVSVPRVISHENTKSFILMEDLGNVDLYSFRDASWKVRQGYYRETLEMIKRLHRFPIAKFPVEKVPLMDGFGPALYRWEREYFLKNFIQAVCGIELDPSKAIKLDEELLSLASRLQEVPLSLVHRDLQSQNIMIRGGQPFFIDFQGMRFGNLFYDLGSLLSDPYVVLAEEERMELLSDYYSLSDWKMDWMAFKEMFWEASAQRLMQALGAYGFLGMKRGRTDFLIHINHALQNLLKVTTKTKRLSLLRALAQKCELSLSEKNILQGQGQFMGQNIC